MQKLRAFCLWLIVALLVVMTGEVVGPPSSILYSFIRTLGVFYQLQFQNLKQLYGWLPENWGALVEMATVGAALLAATALVVNLVDRAARDRPVVGVVAGTLGFGVVQDRAVSAGSAELVNHGHGPAIDVRLSVKGIDCCVQGPQIWSGFIVHPDYERLRPRSADRYKGLRLDLLASTTDPVVISADRGIVLGGLLSEVLEYVIHDLVDRSRALFDSPKKNPAYVHIDVRIVIQVDVRDRAGRVVPQPAEL